MAKQDDLVEKESDHPRGRYRTPDRGNRPLLPELSLGAGYALQNDNMS